MKEMVLKARRKGIVEVGLRASLDFRVSRGPFIVIVLDSKQLIRSLNKSIRLKLDCTPGTCKIVGDVEIDGTGG